MTVFHGNDERWVVPRWRPYRISRASGELDSIGNATPDGTAKSASIRSELEFCLSEFQHDPGLFTAADILSSAALLPEYRPDSLKRVAEYVLLDERSTGVMRQVAESTLREREQPDLDAISNLDQQQARHRVSKLRTLLARDPRNAVLWTDVAHAHIVLGNIESAGRAMRVAYGIAPINRFVVRSYARLLICNEDFDGAVRVLSKPSILERDPWVAAAHLATLDIAGSSIRSLRGFRRMVDSDLPPWHVSELASALASIELKEGRTRHAKRLFRLALQDPTENSVAQAEWSAHKGIDVVNSHQLDKPRGYEARARHALRSELYDEAVGHGLRWLKDQPFALDAALFLTYVASTLVEDYGTAVAAAQIGLLYSPGNPLLLNNYAFALVHYGQVERAQEVLPNSLHGCDEVAKATISATRGLIAYRLGRFDEGRVLYSAAVNALRKSDDYNAANLALALWTAEELRGGGAMSAPLVNTMSAMIGQLAEDAEIRVVASRVLSMARRGMPGN